MKIKIPIFLISFIFVFRSFFAYADMGKIKVTASIPPLAEFAEGVGGDRVEVNTMIPPGANLHTYEPTPNQLKLLHEAKLFIAAGSGIEFELAWLSKLKGINPDLQICDSSKGIGLLSSHDVHDQKQKTFGFRHYSDPHTWLSPVNAIQMVRNIEKAFSKIDPAGKVIYGEQAELYITKLKKIDLQIRSALSPFRGRSFVVYHPAWAYFAKEYSLKEVSLEVEGKEPTARQFSSVIDDVKLKKNRVIFASPWSSAKGAEVVANATHAKVELIDELGPDYTENMLAVSQKIEESLKGS